MYCSQKLGEDFFVAFSEYMNFTMNAALYDQPKNSKIKVVLE